MTLIIHSMIEVGGVGADSGDPVDDAPDAVDERRIKRRRNFFLPGSNNRLMDQTSGESDIGISSRGRKSDVSISLLISGEGGC